MTVYVLDAVMDDCVSREVAQFTNKGWRPSIGRLARRGEESGTLAPDLCVKEDGTLAELNEVVGQGNAVRTQQGFQQASWGLSPD